MLLSSSLHTRDSRLMLLLSVLRGMVVSSYKFSSVTSLLSLRLALSCRLFWMGPRGTIGSWLMVIQGTKKCMEVLGRISKFTFKVRVNIGDTGEEFTEE